jgi:Leucine-rich repeat (LRR) protein
MDSNPSDSMLTVADTSVLSTRLKHDEHFLHEPTLAFLESHVNQQASCIDITVLSLSKLKLNSIGDIRQYQYLRICDLSSNFIRSIDSLLVHCRLLIKLDLHSNRVSQ